MHQLRGLVRRVSLPDLSVLERRVLPHSVSTCFVPISLVDCAGASVSLDVLHPSALLQLLADLPCPEALARVREATERLHATEPHVSSAAGTFSSSSSSSSSALTPLFARGPARVAAAELRHRQALFLAKAEGRLSALDDEIVADIAARLRRAPPNIRAADGNPQNTHNPHNNNNNSNNNNRNNRSGAAAFAMDAARLRGAVEALARRRSGSAAAAIALASHAELPAPGAAAASALADLVALDRPGAALAFLEQFAAKDEAAPAPGTCATHLAARLRGAVAAQRGPAPALEASLAAACRFNVDPGAVFPTDVAGIQRWAEQFTHSHARPAERAAIIADVVTRKRILPRRITVDALSHWCLTHLERQWLADMLPTCDMDRTAGHECAGDIDTETVQRGALTWALKDPKRSLVDNRLLHHYARLLARGDIDPTHESFPYFLEECGECHGDGEMPAELRFVIAAPPAGVSLTSSLLSLAPQCSFWRTMLATRPLSFSATTAPHGHVCVTVQMPQSHTCVSAAFSPQQSSIATEPLSVLHEDDDLLVLSKPARLATSRHALCGAETGALDLTALLMAARPAAIPFSPRQGIVHRLDAETSGCLVVAKHATAHDTLRHQFGTSAACEQRGKIYFALCAALEPDLRRVALSGVLHDATNARITTAYRVLRLFRAARVALVECRVEQGKKHQVRRHLAAAGLPVLQDVEHGGAACSSPVMNRVALHAAAITFVHPTSAEVMTFTAPLPEDFEEAMRLLT